MASKSSWAPNPNPNPNPNPKPTPNPNPNPNPNPTPTQDIIEGNVMEAMSWIMLLLVRCREM